MWLPFSDYRLCSVRCDEIPEGLVVQLCQPRLVVADDPLGELLFGSIISPIRFPGVPIVSVLWTNCVKTKALSLSA
jgi:hypothetical protein